jgi:acetyltransferase-like isoleucine patch superfamily enzyme
VNDQGSHAGSRGAVALRIACTAASILIVQTAVCGLAMLPPVALWVLAAHVDVGLVWRLALGSLMLIPSYVLFALTLLVVSPLASRLTGARTAPHVELRIAEMGWPLMRWVRYVVAIHVVRVLAGALFRGSPMWTFYLRLNGARLGRRVYVNTVFISDHNLLEFGDDVVIGSEVHISGHTVERGLLKTAPVRLGSRVTVGVGSLIDIGVEVGEGCEIGALSFVPKHTTLEGGGVYVGAPARRL